MLQWVIHYLSALPHWGWVLLYGLGGFVVPQGILYSKWYWYEDLIDNKLFDDRRGVLPDWTALVLVVVGWVSFILFGLVGSLITFFDPEVFVGYSRGVGFEMTGLGALALFGMIALVRIPGPLLSGTRKMSSWIRHKLIGLKTKIENDPQRIVAHCKARFKQAQQRRIQIPMEEAKNPDGKVPLEKIDEVIGFDQAGANLLEFLRQLFGLVGHIDEFRKISEGNRDRRARSEKIFSDISSAQLVTMLGIDTFDGAVLQQWKTRAQTIIEAIVLYFDELPAHVAAANIYYEAMQIKGLQEHLAKSLPKTTSSTGIIAEFETGHMQSRLLDELMGKSAEAVPVPTASHATPEMASRPRLVGGGNVRKI
jgi:hypothetical protein